MNMMSEGTTQGFSSDFGKFWLGQVISALGSSFTGFALPLLVYKLTGSAINLAISVAANMVPHLLFGLVIGAWTDRADRKTLMIWADIGRAATIASVPVAGMLGLLTVWQIYAVLFIVSTLGIVFDAANFAAIPSLVGKDDLVTANGRIEASYNAATIVGPLLAGVMIGFMPVEEVLLIDAASFVFSAFALTLIARSFNEIKKERPTTSIRQDVAEGLRYVIGHPVLRNISLMMALVNFVSISIYAQRVYFAKEQLGASDEVLPILWSASAVATIGFAILAGSIRKRWSFGKAALGALMTQGALIIVLSYISNFWVAVPVFALMFGVGSMFNIFTGSLRQAIAPRHMLGRVRTIAGVLAWSANPVGALLGGYLIERTGNVGLVFMGMGILVVAIPAAFYFSPLGHAEDYMPKEEAAPPPPKVEQEERTPPATSQAELEESMPVP
jgi:MFS family permease